MVGINGIGEQGKIAAWWFEGEFKSIFRVSILFRLQDTRKNSSVLYCCSLVGGGRNEFCAYAKQSCFMHRLVGVILVACEVNDVSFSISAGANVTGLLCSAWRWGNPVEEVLASGPGPWKSGSLLRQAASVWMWREGAGIWAPARVQRVALPPEGRAPQSGASHLWWLSWCAQPGKGTHGWTLAGLAVWRDQSPGSHTEPGYVAISNLLILVLGACWSWLVSCHYSA